MAKDILQRIASSGIKGIKKADLKKAYKDCNNTLERLEKNGQVFIEKKGTAYFVWSKENYIGYLTQNDPRCKLVLDMVTGPSQSTAKKAHTNLREAQTISNDFTARNNDFQTIFNKCLNESGTSMGWTSFDKVREKICDIHNLSKEKFYTLASDLIDKNRERYEVSSGGQEGIIVRGLVHGYVRNV